MTNDLRFAARVLLRSPGFALAAVGSLALGIAANAALFAVVDAVFLRPLPYDRPNELVEVNQPRRVPPIDELRHAQSLAGAAAFIARNFPVADQDGVRLAFGFRVSANVFQLLGVRPILGRAFAADEEQKPVVMLSYDYWRRTSGDPKIIGQMLMMDGEPYMIAGVLPADFTLGVRDGQLFIPYRMTEGRFFARLKPGVSRAQAEAEAAAIVGGLPAEPGPPNRDARTSLTPLTDALRGNQAQTLILWQAAVGLVLLMTCANVANLLLVRANARRREFAIRWAIGARRGQVIRQLLTESAMLAALGGGMGLLLASWSLDYVRGLLPASVARILRGAEGLAIDQRVLAFTAGAALLTALLCGIAPLASVLRIDVITGLCDSSLGAGPDRQRLGTLLMTGEVTLAVMLLIGAGLTLRSLARLQNQNLGFSADHVLRAAMDLPPSHYPEARQQAAVFAELKHRIAGLPGVESVGVLAPQFFPFGGPQVRGAPFEIQNRPGSEARAEVYMASPEYLRSVRIPLIKGRWFREDDTTTSAPVAVLSQTVAERYWGQEDPIGRQIRTDLQRAGSPWLTVAGVVGDVRNPLALSVQPTVYRPFAQSPSSGAVLMIRAAGDPLALAPAVRRELRAVDPAAPEFRAASLAQSVADYVTPQRFTTSIFGFFAGLGLLLAGAGVYGVTRHWVVMRIPEFGVRMALGAQRVDVLRQVLVRAAKAAAWGVVAGLAGAVALQRVMASQLFGISATDPAVFVAVPVLLGAAVLIAALIPAWWAARTDPIAALRHE